MHFMKIKKRKGSLQLTNAACPRQKARGLREEPVNVGEALVPHMNGNIDNVGDKTEGR